MITYKYTARDPATGKKVQGTTKAQNTQEVSKVVQSQGYSLLEASPQKSGGINMLGGGRVKSKDKVIFSRQLSTLINAGLPLVQSLRSVSEQTNSKQLQLVLNEVIEGVEGGKSFADSLRTHPKVFDQVFVSLIAAGETSGTLDSALERLANQQEKDAELRSKVRNAMIYPILVLLVMAAVVIFMLVSVLPQVKELYDGIPGASLPLVTRILLAMSNFIVTFWWVVLLVLAGMVFFTSKWARTGPGKEVIDRLKLVLWPVGPLFQKMYMARFARTATTLVSSGVPLIQVLEVTSDAIDNVHVESSLRHATEKVKGGKSLSDALTGDQNFLELVPKMLKIGEDSGALEQMLEKTADYYEKEVDDQIKAISTIIEPVLMIILGIVALTIVSAILLPIYGLVGQDIGGRR